MAPLAPTIGTVELRVRNGLRQRRRDSAYDVEQGEATVPHGVLDVVAEDPEIEHVADQVHPAAVQEHGREHRQRSAGPCASSAGRSLMPKSTEGMRPSE